MWIPAWGRCKLAGCFFATAIFPNHQHRGITFRELSALETSRTRNPEFDVSTKFDFINYGGKLLFFGYSLYHNFEQVKKEKTDELSASGHSKFNSIIIMILMGILLVHSSSHFIDIISTNWSSFPTLVFGVIILSIISLLILEFKYLRLRRK